MNEGRPGGVCSPFPQSQLCTGSWPRCPTERRQHCGGWPRSSPGSLSPVEAEEDKRSKSDFLYLNITHKMKIFFNCKCETAKCSTVTAAVRKLNDLPGFYRTGDRRAVQPKGPRVRNIPQNKPVCINLMQNNF